MRILHVATAWPREPDDPITPWLVHLCERLADHGHEVEVLVSAWRGRTRFEDGHPRIRVHRFRYAPSRWERLTHEETVPDRLDRAPAWTLLVPGYLVAETAAAWRVGRERRFDAVHVHWAVPHGLAGIVAARASDSTLVTTFYGAEIRFAETRFPPALAFLRWYCRRSALVAISENTRRTLSAHTDRPIEVIPYGVPLPTEERKPIDTEVPVVLFVGRLVARKGVDRLLEAMAGLEDREWRLEVVGFGPERESLESHAARLGIASRVEFGGKVSGEELIDAYRRADLFVLPATVDARSDTEGLGVVLLEAMAHGTPVVATRRGGILDVVVDGETGVLVEDEVGALRGGIAMLLDDAELARSMGEMGRRRVLESFGWDRIVGRLEALYEGSQGEPR
ncbi:MAG: glycosyltransferase family 4 protein [Gemmatimonadota bacterium]|nr:glycosyltransferase family 4 protein [Gemmatimonadota bacterium]